MNTGSLQMTESLTSSQVGHSGEAFDALKPADFRAPVERGGSLSRIRTYGHSINSRELYR